MSRPLPCPRGAPLGYRTFCGYCVQPVEDPSACSSRVCPRCNMGLLLSAPVDGAPSPGDALLVVDELLRIRAVSRAGERLLRSPETALVERHVGEVLTSAEIAIAHGGTVTALIASAMRDETARASAAVRPRGVYGIRFCARIVGCRPGPAALLRLEASL